MCGKHLLTDPSSQPRQSAQLLNLLRAVAAIRNIDTHSQKLFLQPGHLSGHLTGLLPVSPPYPTCSYLSIYSLASSHHLWKVAYFLLVIFWLTSILLLDQKLGLSLAKVVFLSGAFVDGSVGKALGIKVWGPEFKSPAVTKIPGTVVYL